MDPEATLAELRALAQQVFAGDAGDAARLAELVDALDQWLSSGGALPQDWRIPPRPRISVPLRGFPTLNKHLRTRKQ